MDEDRRQQLAPWVAAAVAAVTVLAVLLPARADQGGGPTLLPYPPQPVPQALDRVGESLDRCAGAIAAAGLADRYPERSQWRSLAQLASGGMTVALLDDDVPFVCATGPTTVEVSDPQAALPIDRALLIVSTPSGVVAAVAAAEARVEVTTDGEPPSTLAAQGTFLRVARAPITHPDQLAVTVSDLSGIRPLGAPERLALPAVRVVDRQVVPADTSTGAADMLRRCMTAAGADGSPHWTPAQVLAYRRAEQPASLLVAVHGAAVGGCSVAPGEITPLRAWGPHAADGTRPFVWLSPLPDVTANVAAGPVRSDVVRMVVRSGDGPRWWIAVAGGTFAAQAPPGVATDPRSLTVSAYAADDTLVYEGPAVG